MSFWLLHPGEKSKPQSVSTCILALIHRFKKMYIFQRATNVCEVRKIDDFTIWYRHNFMRSYECGNINFINKIKSVFIDLY